MTPKSEKPAKKSAKKSTAKRQSKIKDAATLRREMRETRRALDDKTQQYAATMFAYYFCRSRIYMNSDKIACYLATDGEIAMDAVIERAWRDHKKVYLPVLHPYLNKLQFARYTPDTILVNNRFGIGEPAIAARKRENPLTMEVVLTPLVAYDDQGNRIGMGGGFYDRSFAALKRRNHWQRPLLIGCAHSCQKVTRIQNQSWDLPVASVFTELGRS